MKQNKKGVSKQPEAAIYLTETTTHDSECFIAESNGSQPSLPELIDETSYKLDRTGAAPTSKQTQLKSSRPFETMRGTKDRMPVPVIPFLNQIVLGDSLELLRQLPAESIDAVITSPPYYKQRDYGGGLGNETTIDEYLENMLRVFELCVTAVKHSGSLFVNMGDKYEDGSLLLVPYLFAKKAVEKTGVKLINVITWAKSNPEPRQYKRRLVSSTEPIFHFVKSNHYHYHYDRFMAQRDVIRSKVKAGGHIGKKYFALVDQSDLTEEQKKLAKEEIQQAIQEVKSGAIASFRVKIKGIHSEAYGGHEGGRKNHLRTKGFTVIRMYDRSIKRDIIECPILSIKSLKHPAVYPEFLVQELLSLTTQPGDIVLDPFLGSGTTAVVAKKMGRYFIGFEINEKYCELATTRVAETIVQPALTEFYV